MLDGGNLTNGEALDLGRGRVMLGPMPNLDLMRGIAVCLVVLDHICLVMGHKQIGPWKMEWMGVFGVYLFFLHTALVLMWSLERQPHVLNFYIRRAFRIYPLAMVVICAALMWHVEPSSINLFIDTHMSGVKILRNFMLLQDRSIVSVMWSLTIEVRMYIVLPALFFFATRVKRVWPLLVIWVLAVMEARPLAVWGNELITVVPNFLPGVIAYVAFQRRRPSIPAWAFAPVLALLLTIFLMHPTVAQSWPLSLALGLLLPMFHQIRNRVLVRCAHVMADYSYGIYLGHPFGILIGFLVLRGWNPVLQISVELIATVLIAIAGYHLVEKPGILLGKWLAREEDRRYAAA